jgi:hypothetical protein
MIKLCKKTVGLNFSYISTVLINKVSILNINNQIKLYKSKALFD